MAEHTEILNRWRLVLGKNAREQMALSDPTLDQMDQALDFLYGREAPEDVRDPQGGRESGIPTVAHWLSKIRTLFPKETAEILQRHALERYQLTELLADQEILERMEPNQALLETVLSLKHMMKGPVLDTARRIVERVAAQLTEQMRTELQQSALGKPDRNSRNGIRSLRNLDIKRTIRDNLSHYDPEKKQLRLEKVLLMDGSRGIIHGE